MSPSKKIILSFCAVLLVAQCVYAQLYREVEYNRVKTRSLSSEQLNALKNFLQHKTGQAVKDTILIKYDFDRGDCWYLMDEREPDAKIRGRIARHVDFMRTVRENRPAASIFFIREPGNRANKIVRLDSSITIDSSRLVLNLLFKKGAACGSSALILPDGRFIVTKDESHFFALYYTKEQVEQVFKKKKIKRT